MVRIRLRSDGRYEVRIRGKSFYFRSEEEAKSFLSQGEGEVVPALRSWIDLRADLSPATRDDYQASLRAWEPFLRGKSFVDLSPSFLTEVLAAWGREGVGARTLEKRYRFLAAALRSLGKGELLSGVPKPRSRPLPRPLWGEEEARRFLSVCPDRKWGKLFAFLLLTGLRLGEALALDWQDLGPDWVRVTKTFVRGQIRPPKTAAGVRTVPLPPLAWEFLGERSRGWVFRTERGSIPSRANLLRNFRSLCQEAQVPRIRIHDLRKVHASLLLWHGIDPKTVQSLLGHSTPFLTLQVYAQALGAKGKEQVERAWGEIIVK